MKLTLQIRDYLKKVFTVPERPKPAKIWCFYPEPYQMGLAATSLTATVIIAALLLIALIGSGAFLILCGLGLVITILFYGLLIIIGGLGLTAFKEGCLGGVLGTAITTAIAYSIYAVIGGPVLLFLFGRRGWDATDSGIFDYGLWSFEQLSSPLIWSLNFVQTNWLGVLSIIVAPAITVCAIAALLVLGMYTLQGMEKLIQYYYGIRFPCPVCGRKSEPAKYHCSNCGQAHQVNLVPSVYGVLNHTCANIACAQPMPTMMLLGRTQKVKRKCPHEDCGTVLNEVTGSDKHIALIGGRNAGKTCLLIQAAKYMIDEYQAELPEEEQQQQYQQLENLINNGEAPPQTQRTTSYRAFQLIYEKRFFPYHLHLYDIAGENFEHIFDSASYPFYKNLDAIIFIFDPYSIPSFRSNHEPPRNMAFSSQEPLEVLQNLIQALEKYNARSRIKAIKCNVILTKTDTGYLEQLTVNEEKGENMDQALERFVGNTIGEQAFVEVVRSTFKKARYFPVSALGRTPDPDDRSPFVGENVRTTIQAIYKSIGVTI